MYSTDGSSSAVLGNAFFSPKVFSILAGIFCILAGATALNHVRPKAGVTLDLRPWTWMSHLDLSVRHLEETQVPATQQTFVVHPSQKLLGHHAGSQHHHQRAIWAKRASPSVKAMIANETDLERVQSVYKLLHQQFLVTQTPEHQEAVRPKPTKTTRVAARLKSSVSTAQVSTHFISTKKAAKTSIHPVVTAASAPSFHHKKRLTRKIALATHLRVKQVREKKERVRNEALAHAHRKTSQPVLSRAALVSSPSLPRVKVQAPATPVAAVTSPALSISPPPVATAAVGATPSSNTQNVIGYSMLNGYPKTQTAALSWSMITQRLSQIVPPAVAAPHDTPSTRAQPEQINKNTQMMIQAPPVPVVPDAPTEPRAIEAFDWQTPVQDAEAKNFTKEIADSDSRSTGWKIMKSQEHWPTLYWRGKGSPVVAQTPLISNNAAAILSKLAGVSLQEDTGIVFGKVPAGWGIEISGRAERAVYLDAQNQRVNQEDTAGDRYFALLNAEPGAHLLYRTGSAGQSGGAVAIPVLSGMATYIDVSIHTTGEISGQVVGPDLPVEVRVVGQSVAKVETDETGKFTINDVEMFGGIPLFIETEGQSGYTHRYRVNPMKSRGLTLFRLSADQIQDWLGELEGGISPESGLVIAALPGLVQKHENDGVFAEVETTLDNPTIVPENYVITEAGQLTDHVPLDPNSPRLLSVQVPEGPAVARATNKNGKALWSELLFVSPGVVNMVGPY